MKRIHLTNRETGSFIEWKDDEDGMKAAKAFRKANRAYKGMHIKHILQLMPDKVELGKEYDFCG